MLHEKTSEQDCESLGADFVALYLAHHHTMPSLDGRPPASRQSQCTCSCQHRKEWLESAQLYGTPQEDAGSDSLP